MRLFCDLHIHSCLSPCGDELMTPNNIAGMAMLKGLDAIAVADHNSARNLPALSKTCAAMGVLLLPAMELTTAEEAHLLSYFPTVEAALAFSEELHGHLPPIQNRPDIFGPQQVLDEDDEQVGSEDLLLLNALSLSSASTRAAGRRCRRTSTAAATAFSTCWAFCRRDWRSPPWRCGGRCPAAPT